MHVSSAVDEIPRVRSCSISRPRIRWSGARNAPFDRHFGGARSSLDPHCNSHPRTLPRPSPRIIPPPFIPPPFPFISQDGQAAQQPRSNSKPGDVPPRSLPFVYWRGAAHREKVRFSPRKKMRSTRLEFGRNGRSRGGEYFLGEVKIGRSGYNSRCTRSLTFPSSSDERRSAEQRRASSSARSLRDISPAIKMRVR